MSTFLDIFQSIIIGGMILFVTLNANFTLRQSWSSFNHQSIVQDMLVTTAQILECDLRNMGCGVSNAAETILEAQDTTITFRMAKSGDYNADMLVITYWLGSPDESGAVSTDNPKDRWLWRDEDGKTETIGLVTEFHLKYLDKYGEEMSQPILEDELINIRLIEITMEVQSPYPAIYDPDAKYATALWKQTRLASQNLYRIETSVF